MAGDWRITTEERARFDTFFQQCNPVQGYLTGEQARDFFIKSHLPGDILRKIWDLADITSDGRLDKREFAIACYLISSQVQKKGPLPATLPSSLLSDSSAISNGGGTPSSPTTNLSEQSPSSNINSSSINSLTPSIRSKYLQQFHTLVDVSKTNGFMSGQQAKTILQQTGLSNIILHQIWNLSDHDKDGRLTSDEFIVAMHCCELARTGQTLPQTLPDDWLIANVQPTTYADLNQQLQETINATDNTAATEAEKKLTAQTYEEKRQKNYEEGNRELERRRQLLREQEEHDQKEREERERKRELELQKQREEQERKKQLEIERQLEKQRQIEQQKEEERKKLFEQREAARKEMERKSRLEWERQRMQELSSQKTRLLDQINDLKSRSKGGELELESMDDTVQTCQIKITQIEANIHSTDETIAELQRNISSEKNLFEDVEQQKKDFMTQLNQLQTERETLDANVNQLTETKEFYSGNPEADQIKSLQTQIENLEQENKQIDEDITKSTEQCQDYQNQLQQLRLQFEQLEQEAKDKKPPSVPTSPTDPPPESVEQSTSSPTVDVDPFQTVDPFPAQSDLRTTTVDPFQPPTNDHRLYPVLPSNSIDTPDPAVVASPKVKKAAPKANPQLRTEAPKQPAAAAADPWGTPANAPANSTEWASFDQSKNESPFGTTAEWPQAATSSSDMIQYRALYDYQGERPDELSLTAGEIIMVDPSKQQDEHWLFGHTSNEKQGYFPAAYSELVETSTPQIDVKTSEHEIYEAIYSYEGTDASDLSFDVGEHIIILKHDGDWWTGQIGDRIGAFPHNYVQKLEHIPPTAIAIQTYQSTEEGYLSFDKDQIIHIINHDNEKNLYQGEIQLPDQTIRTGWFPVTCVQMQTSSEPSGLSQYIAIFPYEAQQEDELSFPADAILEVFDEENTNGWFKARLGHQIGLVPATYIQAINAHNLQ